MGTKQNKRTRSYLQTCVRGFDRARHIRYAHFVGETAKAGVIPMEPVASNFKGLKLMKKKRHTLPLRFQVPTKKTHCLVVEYSEDLDRSQISAAIKKSAFVPLLQCSPYVVMYWIIDRDLELVTEVSLEAMSSGVYSAIQKEITKNMSIATCFPLS